MEKRPSIKIIKISGIVLLTLVAIFFIGLQVFLRGFNKEIAKVPINNVDLSTMADGEYIGEYSFNDVVGARVAVWVQSNKITYIAILEHRNGMGSKAETIVNSVVEAQSLEVDLVSGASGSSKVILKAIENALKEN